MRILIVLISKLNRVGGDHPVGGEREGTRENLIVIPAVKYSYKDECCFCALVRAIYLKGSETRGG